MAIRTLPTQPRRTDDPDTFIANTDAWMSAIPGWTDDANTLAANLNSIAAGGAFAIPYTVDTSSTADADPGNGKLRFNNATQSSATVIFVDTLAAGQDVSGLLADMAASSSGTKGKLRLVKTTDTTKWITYTVTAVTSATGYYKLTVTSAWGVGTTPFSSNDSVILMFQRTGDKGDTALNSQFTPVDMAAGTNVDLTLGNYFLKTMSANTTLTFGTPPSQGFGFVIELTLTSGTLTLPASVTTANNSAITLTAGKTHLLSFFTSSTGAKWRMSSSLNYTT